MSTGTIQNLDLPGACERKFNSQNGLAASVAGIAAIFASGRARYSLLVRTEQADRRRIFRWFVATRFIEISVGQPHECGHYEHEQTATRGAVQLGQQPRDSLGFDQFAGLLQVVVNDRLGMNPEAVINRRQHFGRMDRIFQRR